MNGIIVINKPKGITSRDVVNKISKILNTKKIGHNGTLDPLATGVLIICIGKYTKLNELLSSKEKEYIAEITLGVKTDTLDIEGKVLEKKEEILDIEKLKDTITNFQKTYMQIVPIYSAVKVDGKKLYEYAREGKKVELPKKEVTIKSIELLDHDKNKFKIKALVSKGTYIRSLIKDILDEMHIIGTMSNLKRTKQGNFNIEDAFTIEDIKKGNYKLLKIKDVLDIPIIIVDDTLKTRIINGVKLKENYPDKVLFIDKDGNELAIYKKEKDEMKVDVMLV
ncbi:MAG: tRNA pseudouridine(55) synthase TruB [Bacilli bacterium]|nr:tRNA pseudouridine(55) synthase TruB [Bacilli bacterium]